MHQPDYRDAKAQHAMMPWVRLHGIKDYLDMVTILDDFPKVRQNFNLVPSLLDQLQGYVDGSLSDQALELTLKKADLLTVEDRVSLLGSFFHAHWDNMVKPYPRYWELLKMRGFHPSAQAMLEVQRYFSQQDFLDLQVWYNLVWFDPVFRTQYPFLLGLIRRGRNFTEDDKQALILLQQQILSKIIPAYRSRHEAGRIELSTTPYYHPILPLLYDSNLASISQPHDPLPSLRFSHPEDVATQINRAMERHEQYFGHRPVGMWPSEGSVCQEIIPYFYHAGIQWIATDEGILANSIGREPQRNQFDVVNDPASWYRSHRIEEGNGGVDVIFRDHLLSDLIGFVYSRWNENQAADDFIQRLLEIKKAMGNQVGERAVAIILDGENAWEHYPGDGAPFLRELYGRLNDSSELEAVTIADYLSRRREPAPQIKRIYPGSWINRNFRIWIGHQEDNLAWDYLGQARRTLVLFEQQHKEKIKADTSLKEKINNAWEHIYIAEGSDWCWWYGDDHSSENDADFDELFRQHLISVYLFLDEAVPENLSRPIIQIDKKLHPKTEIISFINPKIDGDISSYYEWRAAALYDVAQLGGAMHRSEYLVKEIFYGFSLEKFFLRIDIERKFLIDNDYLIDISIVKGPQKKVVCQICYMPETQRLTITYNRFADTERLRLDESCLDGEICFAVDTILELGISFAFLELVAGNDLNFAVTIKQHGEEVQTIPSGGYLHLTVPGPDFEEHMWYV